MNRPAVRNAFLLGAAVVWLGVNALAYYRVHKPLDAQQFLVLASAALDLALALGMLTLCAALGRRVLKASPGCAIQAALGATILSTTWLLLGAAGLFHPLAAWGILLGGLAWLRHEAFGWWKDLAAEWALWKPSGSLEKGFLAAGALFTSLQLLAALCPPARWDALTYHLQLPRLYEAAGRLAFIPGNPYWGHPQLAEMLYTWAMLLHQPESAAAFSWVLGMVFLLGVGGLVAKHTSSSSAPWLAVMMLLSGYSLRSMLSWAYTDLLAALMGLAVLACLLEFLRHPQTRWMLLAGLFAGLAAGVKWTSGLLLAPVMLSVFIPPVLSIRRRLSLASMALGVLLLAVLPWLLKNLLVTGNPLYPYFLPTPWIPAARLAAANTPPESASWLDLALLPLTISWHGVEGALSFGSDLGPLLGLLLLPGLWIRRREPAARLVAFSLLAAWLVMALGGSLAGHLRQSRLYLGFLAFAALPCAWGWEWLAGVTLHGVRVRRLAGAFVWVVLFFAALQDLSETAKSNPLAYLTGSVDRRQVLEDRLGWYARAAQELNSLPPGARTLMLWEPRGLYAPLNSDPDPWIDRFRSDLWALGSPQAVLDSWKDAGYTHLLLFRTGADMVRQEAQPMSPADWQAFDELMALIPPPRSIGGIYELYLLPK